MNAIDPIVARLQNAYLRGYRRAVAGQDLPIEPNSTMANHACAYTAGYSAGKRALKMAISSASEYAQATVNGERTKP